MATSERTPWQPGKIVRELWVDGAEEIQRRFKLRNNFYFALEKKRATQLVEISAALANGAILTMMITAIKDTNNHDN